MQSRPDNYSAVSCHDYLSENKTLLGLQILSWTVLCVCIFMTQHKVGKRNSVFLKVQCVIYVPLAVLN